MSNIDQIQLQVKRIFRGIVPDDFLGQTIDLILHEADSLIAIASDPLSFWDKTSKQPTAAFVRATLKVGVMVSEVELRTTNLKNFKI